MKCIKKVFGIVLAVALVLCLSVTALAADVPTLSVKASSTAVETGNNVKITLSTDVAVENIFAFQMDLYYDDELFELIGTETDGYDYSNNTDSNEDRYIRIMKMDLSGEHILDGDFITFEFKTLKDGSYNFEISGVKFTDSSSTAIAVNEPEAVTVTVSYEPVMYNGTVTTEPSTEAETGASTPLSENTNVIDMGDNNIVRLSLILTTLVLIFVLVVIYGIMKLKNKKN